MAAVGTRNDVYKINAFIPGKLNKFFYDLSRNEFGFRILDDQDVNGMTAFAHFLSDWDILRNYYWGNAGFNIPYLAPYRYDNGQPHSKANVPVGSPYYGNFVNSDSSGPPRTRTDIYIGVKVYIWGPDKCKDFIEDWLDATARSKRQATFDGLVLEDISCVDLSNNAKGNPEATDVFFFDPSVPGKGTTTYSWGSLANASSSGINVNIPVDAQNAGMEYIDLSGTIGSYSTTASNLNDSVSNKAKKGWYMALWVPTFDTNDNNVGSFTHSSIDEYKLSDPSGGNGPSNANIFQRWDPPSYTFHDKKFLNTATYFRENITWAKNAYGGGGLTDLSFCGDFTGRIQDNGIPPPFEDYGPSGFYGRAFAKPLFIPHSYYIPTAPNFVYNSSLDKFQITITSQQLTDLSNNLGYYYTDTWKTAVNLHIYMWIPNDLSGGTNWDWGGETWGTADNYTSTSDLTDGNLAFRSSEYLAAAGDRAYLGVRYSRGPGPYPQTKMYDLSFSILAQNQSGSIPVSWPSSAKDSAGNFQDITFNWPTSQKLSQKFSDASGNGVGTYFATWNWEVKSDYADVHNERWGDISGTDFGYAVDQPYYHDIEFAYGATDGKRYTDFSGNLNVAMAQKLKPIDYYPHIPGVGSTYYNTTTDIFEYTILSATGEKTHLFDASVVNPSMFNNLTPYRYNNVNSDGSGNLTTPGTNIIQSPTRSQIDVGFKVYYWGPEKVNDNPYNLSWRDVTLDPGVNGLRTLDLSCIDLSNANSYNGNIAYDDSFDFSGNVSTYSSSNLDVNSNNITVKTVSGLTTTSTGVTLNITPSTTNKMKDISNNLKKGWYFFMWTWDISSDIISTMSEAASQTTQKFNPPRATFHDPYFLNAAKYDRLDSWVLNYNDISNTDIIPGTTSLKSDFFGRGYANYVFLRHDYYIPQAPEIAYNFDKDKIIITIPKSQLDDLSNNGLNNYFADVYKTRINISIYLWLPAGLMGMSNDATGDNYSSVTDLSSANLSTNSLYRTISTPGQPYDLKYSVSATNTNGSIPASFPPTDSSGNIVFEFPQSVGGTLDGTYGAGSKYGNYYALWTWDISNSTTVSNNNLNYLYTPESPIYHVNGVDPMTSANYTDFYQQANPRKFVLAKPMDYRPHIPGQPTSTYNTLTNQFDINFLTLVSERQSMFNANFSNTSGGFFNSLASYRYNNVTSDNTGSVLTTGTNMIQPASRGAIDVGANIYFWGPNKIKDNPTNLALRNVALNPGINGLTTEDISCIDLSNSNIANGNIGYDYSFNYLGNSFFSSPNTDLVNTQALTVNTVTGTMASGTTVNITPSVTNLMKDSSGNLKKGWYFFLQTWDISSDNICTMSEASTRYTGRDSTIVQKLNPPRPTFHDPYFLNAAQYNDTLTAGWIKNFRDICNNDVIDGTTHPKSDFFGRAFASSVYILQDYYNPEALTLTYNTTSDKLDITIPNSLLNNLTDTGLGNFFVDYYNTRINIDIFLWVPNGATFTDYGSTQQGTAENYSTVTDLSNVDLTNTSKYDISFTLLAANQNGTISPSFPTLNSSGDIVYNWPPSQKLSEKFTGFTSSGKYYALWRWDISNSYVSENINSLYIRTKPVFHDNNLSTFYRNANPATVTKPLITEPHYLPQLCELSHDRINDKVKIKIPSSQITDFKSNGLGNYDITTNNTSVSFKFYVLTKSNPQLTTLDANGAINDLSNIDLSNNIIGTSGINVSTNSINGQMVDYNILTINSNNLSGSKPNPSYPTLNSDGSLEISFPENSTLEQKYGAGVDKYKKFYVMWNYDISNSLTTDFASTNRNFVDYGLRPKSLTFHDSDFLYRNNNNYYPSLKGYNTRSTFQQANFVSKQLDIKYYLPGYLKMEYNKVTDKLHLTIPKEQLDDLSKNDMLDKGFYDISASSGGAISCKIYLWLQTDQKKFIYPYNLRHYDLSSNANIHPHDVLINLPAQNMSGSVPSSFPSGYPGGDVTTIWPPNQTIEQYFGEGVKYKGFTHYGLWVWDISSQYLGGRRTMSDPIVPPMPTFHDSTFLPGSVTIPQTTQYYGRANISTVVIPCPPPDPYCESTRPTGGRKKALLITKTKNYSNFKIRYAGAVKNKRAAKSFRCSK